MTDTPTVTVRLRHTHVRQATETDRTDTVARTERERWTMFGELAHQQADHHDIATTIRPRGHGGALALRHAIETSPHHVLVEPAST